MAAGPATILPQDGGLHILGAWQLLKSLSIAQTAITAAKLSQNLRDVSFAESTVEFVDVSAFESIRVQVWGVASNNDAPVIDLYGWSDTGPGAHIGKVTLAYGNFTSAASTGFHAQTQTSKSIREAFVAGTAYQGCDTYTITADYEQEIYQSVDTAGIPITTTFQNFRSINNAAATATVSPLEADFPIFFTVDFSRSRYKYFGVLVTTLAGTTLGAIYKPIKMRQ